MRVDGFSKSEKWEASITCHHIGFLLRNCLLQANCTTLCMCNPVVNDMELRFHTTERFTLKNMRRLDERIRSCRIPYALLVIWSYCRFKQIYGSSVYSVICLTVIFKQQFICLNFESMTRDCSFELGLISSITTFTNFLSINLSCVLDTVSSV